MGGGGCHRNDLKDLWAKGEDPRLLFRAESRIRPPRILGVLAQNAQM
jgi:hypothetical protein